MLCGAKLPFLFSSLFSLIFSLETTIFFQRKEKNEKRKEKRTKKKRQSSFENCRFFLVEARGIEPLSENTSKGASPGADGL